MLFEASSPSTAFINSHENSNKGYNSNNNDIYSTGNVIEQLDSMESTIKATDNNGKRGNGDATTVYVKDLNSEEKFQQHKSNESINRNDFFSNIMKQIDERVLIFYIVMSSCIIVYSCKYLNKLYSLKCKL